MRCIGAKIIPDLGPGVGVGVGGGREGGREGWRGKSVPFNLTRRLHRVVFTANVPRKLLCVVLVTTSLYAKGESACPPATNPETWACE